LKVLSVFSHGTLNPLDIDVEFCERFKDVLLNLKHIHSKTQTITTTASDYWFHFSYLLKLAVKEKVISSNPCNFIKFKKSLKDRKMFLTLNELKTLLKTDFQYTELRRAFIFSCLTGLRWSDIYKLTWLDVQVDGEKYSLSYVQKKTEEVNYLPLQEQALSYIGKRGLKNEKVFSLHNYNVKISRRLQLWVAAAGYR
jgi:site-specific recombinase XerD